jgi:hypothetical protein
MNPTTYTLAILVICCLFTTCTEEISTHTDIGDEYIAGQLRLRLPDDSDPLGAPLPGARINLYDAADPDTVNYLFSTTTDTEGFFTFTVLTSGTEYVLRYRDSIDNTLYAATSAPSLVGTDSLALIATLATNRQTGIQLRVLGPSGRPATGVKSCFYRDTTIANAVDSSSCVGADFVLTSGAGGKVADYGMPAGEYTVLSSLDVGKQRWRSRDTLTVPPSRVIEASVRLSPPPPSPRTITLLSRDANHEPLPGARVCLYTSRLLLSESDTCAGAAYGFTTAATGHRTVEAPPDGRYYGLAVYTLNDSTRWLDSQLIELPARLRDTVVFSLAPE